MRFDLKLFSELNEEHKSKPLVHRAPVYKRGRLTNSGNRRAAILDSKYGLAGKRIIEIGCGRGETCRAIAKAYGCEVVGIDIKRYPQWAENPTDGVALHALDLSEGAPADLGLFDFGCSFAVWEHVRHPFAMLKAVHALLRPGASFHFIANLYRGPKASHRYRQVYFPWPHLLFTDEVFEEYYVSIGQQPQRAAWVNQLSIADYFRYFEMVGFDCGDVKYDVTPIDEPFYQRFEDKLSRFPRFDLERDFIHVTLTKRSQHGFDPQTRDLHGTPQNMKRVLIFNFFGGVMDRGIPLYSQDIAECMRRIGLEPIELRCPRALRRLPRMLRNALFVLFEQVAAPVVRVLRGCALTVYPYNSAGLVDATLGRSVIVVHDLIGNSRGNAGLAARYVRCTQAAHRKFARTVCVASTHTLAQLRRLPAFRRCALRLWPNSFYAFEAALSRRRPEKLRGGRVRLRVLLCSGIGPNKDYSGALTRFGQSRVLKEAELRIVGFGDEADFATRQASHLSAPVRERIVVLPRLSLDELVAEYAASDLVWVHSQNEGFGRFVIEAMMCGRPVLASNIGAFRKLKGPGVYLYRRGHFDEAVAHALSGGPAPNLNIASYHAPLESAVREVVDMHT